ncbi:MAG: hypothetical protein IKZ82_08490, partial [Clostridia bacterium]|nr:hypothetical protein [Clostridia bacterium]
TVPDGANYTIDYTDWNWYTEEDGNTMSHSDVFDNEEYAYYQYFEIVPAEGYVFADEVTVTINGDPALADFFGWDEEFGCFYVYTIDFSVVAPVSGILGDVDLDGDVDTADALLALRYVMGLVDLNEDQLAQAEVTGDENVSVADCLLILRKAMGVIDSFPAEEP